MSRAERWKNVGTSAKPWLESFSHLSQVLAVVLAAYGYFHTVLPVFQKEKLDEDVAKLQLEQERSEAELSSLRERQKAADATLAASNAEAKRASELATQMRAQAQSQAAIANALRTKNIAVQETLSTTKKVLVESEWKAFAQDLALGINFKAERSATFFMMWPFFKDWSGGPPPWPDAYALAVAEIPNAGNKVSVENRPLIEKQARAYLESHAVQFKCEAPGDVNSLPDGGAYSQQIRDAAPRCGKKLDDAVQTLLGLNWQDVSQ